MATVEITVLPKQDDDAANANVDEPKIVELPVAQVVDEDQVLDVPRIVVWDVDAQPTYDLGLDHTQFVSTLPNGDIDPAWDGYDPDWRGRVTLSVEHGTLTLPGAVLPSLTFITDVDVDGDGTLDVSDGVGDPIMVFEGLLADLNAALADVDYLGDKDYNSGDPSNEAGVPVTGIPDYAVVPDVLTITIDDLHNTDILNLDGDSGTSAAALSSTATVDIAVNPKQDTPDVPVVPGAQVADEDTVLKLPAFSVFDVDVRNRPTDPHDLADYDPDWEGTVTISVLYGTLWLADGGVDTGVSYVTYTGDHTHTITFTGGLDDLNEALLDENVRYQADQDFNSRNRADSATETGAGTNATDVVPNDTLTITIDDQLNTDILNRDLDDTNNVTSPIGTASAAVDIAVNPVQDRPTIILTDDYDLPPSVLEDEELKLPAIVVADVDHDDWVTLPDGSAVRFVYDPDWAGQVTLSVNSGMVWLNDPTEVTVTGQRMSTMTLTGSLDALNSALTDQNLRYQGNANFNGDDTLTITVHDLGNTGTGDALSEWKSTTNITVVPVDDPPFVATPITPVAVLVGTPSHVVDLSNVFDDPDIPPDALTLSYEDSVDNNNRELVVGELDPTEQTLTLTFPTDQTGEASLTVHATDTTGRTIADTFAVAVIAPPVAGNDSVITDEDRPVTIFLYTNDTDADGTVVPSTAAIVAGSGPSHGTVTITNGVARYTPDPNFPNRPTVEDFAEDSFRYTIRDNAGVESNEATVTIRVNEVPDYQNPAIFTDVNRSGETSPLDALIVINYLNKNGNELPADPAPPIVPQYVYDVDGNNLVTPLDVLQIVIALNNLAAGGEGEQATVEAPADAWGSGAGASAGQVEAVGLLVVPDSTLPAPVAVAAPAVDGNVRHELPSGLDERDVFRADVDHAAVPERDSAFAEIGVDSGEWIDLAMDDILSDLTVDVETAGSHELAVDRALNGRIRGIGR